MFISLNGFQAKKVRQTPNPTEKIVRKDQNKLPLIKKKTEKLQKELEFIICHLWERL